MLHGTMRGLLLLLVLAATAVLAFTGVASAQTIPALKPPVLGPPHTHPKATAPKAPASATAKASPTKMDPADAARLDAASAHLRELDAAARPYAETRDRIVRQYQLGPGDAVDFTTGAITRAQQSKPKDSQEPVGAR